MPSPSYAQHQLGNELMFFIMRKMEMIGPEFRADFLFDAIKATDLTAAEMRLLGQRLDREADQLERDAN